MWKHFSFWWNNIIMVLSVGCGVFVISNEDTLPMAFVAPIAFVLGTSFMRALIENVDLHRALEFS